MAGRGQAARIAVAIVASGVIALGVLSERQGRLQAAHELAQARLRIRRHQERVLDRRAQIAPLVTPETIREVLGDDAEPVAALRGP